MLASIILFFIGIFVILIPINSGKPLSELNIDLENASEIVQLLSSINENIHTLKSIAVFLFRLFGIALIISGIVMFFESLF